MSKSLDSPAAVVGGAAVKTEPSVWRRAYDQWMKIAHVIGRFNTRVIMSVLYFIIVLPIGLIFRLFSDPLQLREPENSNWVVLPPEDHKIESARQQF